MIDDALRSALVTALGSALPGPRDDARARELAELAETVAGIVRAHDGRKVVGLRGFIDNSACVSMAGPHSASTPGWDDPRKAEQHFPAGR